MIRRHKQFTEPDLWCVGFRLNALSLISILSGLVEVIDTFCEHEEQALFVTVRNLDKTGTRF